MKKVLVLGRAGMLGHIVYETFSNIDEFEVVGCARNAVDAETEVIDVSEFQALELLFERVQPDIVVNCIGVLIQGSVDSIGNAILLNSYLPHRLVDFGEKFHFKVIHVSTDCVFSGERGGYRDTDLRDGDTSYARSKTLGEVFDTNHLTIRTSIIGPELKSNGTGLVDWFLKQHGEVEGYCNAYWSGVTTIELAKAIVEFIRQDITGLYQFTVEPKISKYDLLLLIKRVWDLDRLIVTENPNYYCDKSLLSNRDDFRWCMLTYEKMIVNMKKWIDDRPHLYEHYRI